MTRRTGLRAAAAVAVAGLVAVVAGGFVAGSGGGDGDRRGGKGSGRGDEVAGPSTTTTAPPVGMIRLAVPEEPASLDPFDPRSRAEAASAILGEVLPQLFRVRPDGGVEGYLADEATVREEPGAVAAAFSLREGARWSDGTPVTVEDLRFTLETVRSAAWPGPRAGYDRVTAIEGAGPDVVVRFDGPFPGWRRLFSGADFVLPAHRLRGQDLKTVWAAGPDVAGGPFRLGGVSAGLEVVLLRNELWWGDGPRVEGVRVIVVPDVRTMEQLLGRGELDVAWPPTTTNRVVRFRALEGVDVSVAPPGGRIEWLVANAETLAADRRRALLAVVDRDRFVDVLLEGEAERAQSLAGPGEGPTWTTVRPDPERPGLDEEVLATVVASEEDPMAPLLGRILESRARAREATLELKFAEASKVEAVWLPEGRFDVALAEAVAWPDPCWRCWFGGEAVGRGNVARIRGVDDLAIAAERGDGDAVRALEERVRDDGLALPLWRGSAVLAARGVDGVEANSWALGPLWGAHRWVLRAPP